MAGPSSSDDWAFDLFPDAPAKVGRKTGRPRSGNTARPGGVRPSTRALRLGVAIALFVIATVLIVSVAAGNNEGDADRAYLSALAQPANASQAVGTALVKVLAGSLPSYGELESTLSGLLQRQQQALSEGTAIQPSPTLRSEYQPVIDALQFRVDGLTGLLKGFRDANGGASNGALAAVLSAEAERLVASDVLWEDDVVQPADAQAARDGARNVSAPPSTFLSNADLALPSTMTAILEKLRSPAAAVTPTQLLKAGDTGPAVSGWQRSLNAWLARQSGQTELPITGTFDQATVNATQALQAAEQISVDGVVGPATRNALKTAQAG